MCSHETHSRLPHKCSKQSILAPTAKIQPWGQAPNPGRKALKYNQKGGAESLTENQNEQLNNDQNGFNSALPKVQNHNPDAEQILSYLQANGMIDLDGVAASMKKTEAERILKEKHPYKISCGKDGRWRTYIKDETKKNGMKMVVKSTEEKLKEALVEHYQGEDPEVQRQRLTLEKLYPKWIKFKALHTPAGTYITRIEREWKRYYEGTEITYIPIVKLTKLMLDEWVHRLIKDNNMSSKQYYNATVIMRQALDYAVDLEVIEYNPLSRVRVDGRRLFRKERKKESCTQVFTEEEVRQIEEFVRQDTEKPAHSRIHKLAPLGVLFMLKTGIRIGEMLAVRYEDVSENGKWIHIQRQYRYETDEIVEHTKGAEGDRFVPLPTAARDIIRTAKAKQQEYGTPDDGYIFSSTEKPLPYQPVQYQFSHYSKKLQTVQKSSHKARKTYISALIDEGLNLNSVREFVGHTDERTTLHNYCFDRSNDDERLALVEKAVAV